MWIETLVCVERRASTHGIRSLRAMVPKTAVHVWPTPKQVWIASPVNGLEMAGLRGGDLAIYYTILAYYMQLKTI